MKNEPCHLTAIVFDGVDKLYILGLSIYSLEVSLKTPHRGVQKYGNFALNIFINSIVLLVRRLL